jgi:hypothetical protein
VCFICYSVALQYSRLDPYHGILFIAKEEIEATLNVRQRRKEGAIEPQK